MKRLFLVAGCWILASASFGQPVSDKLKTAIQQFEADSQLRHAIISLYVIDAATGAIVFDKNSQVGLAPASTQKIITSVTAFELLGKDFRYKTELGYDGTIKKDMIDGDLWILGSGDPTLGSWRWVSTKDTVVFTKWVNAIKALNVKILNGQILTSANKFSYQGIPDGWIWQDIGNYYGAGSYEINWKENQYDLILQSGNKVGDDVKIVKSGHLNGLSVLELKTAAKGTGDNAYIYYNDRVSGTIPLGENAFTISGAAFDPWLTLRKDFLDFTYKKIPSSPLKDDYPAVGTNIKKFYTHYSPSLDSIIHWFNKKSINLYGEALIKTFAYEKLGFGSTDSGVAILRKFWKEKGLDEEELNMYDGSGLSPLNRVTTHAQVEILKYAKTRDWFPYFYEALPEFNKMKMKSGTISDVKAFCGYHKAADGKEYIFSFLVNNYSGRSTQLVSKMYKVLDVLK